jgi:hypothetical protein
MTARRGSPKKDTDMNYSAEQLKLVDTAYVQCNGAYKTAVDVMKFTWKMFYTRSAAVLAGAGYTLIHPEHAAWAGGVVLLLVSAASTACISGSQFMQNQVVIRKAIIAGVDLEQSHAELGCRFRLDALGEGLTGKFSDLHNTVNEELRNRSFADFGVTPNYNAMCFGYAGLEVVLAIFLGYVGMHLC